MRSVVTNFFSLLPAFFIFAALSLSCSTTHKETNLEDLSQKQTLQQKEWLAKYKLARAVSANTPPQACEIFTYLASNSTFLLSDLALMRAHLTCEHPGALPVITKEWLEEKPWLNPLNVERELREAEVSNDSKKLAKALIERSKQSILNKEKLEFLQRALEQAKLSQDQELLSDTQDRYYHVAPRLNPSPSKKEWFRISQDFLLQREFNEARKYCQKILSDKEFSADEKYQALKQIRSTYKLEQKKTDHIKAAQELVTWLKKNRTEKSSNEGRINEAYLTLARAHWTEGDISMARQTLNQAMKELKGRFPLNDINFILGKIAEEAHDEKSAIKYFQVAETEVHDSQTAKEKILFAQAWILRKTEEFEKAAVKFAELEKISNDRYAKFKYRFWQGQSWEQAGQPEVSHRLFKGLTEEDPLGYYGLVSFYKLNEAIPALKINNSGSIEPTPNLPLDLTLQRKMRALVEVEEKEVLAKLITTSFPQLRTPAVLNQEVMLFIFKNLAEGGLYQPLFTQLALLDSDTKNKLLETHPELLFPKKYLELIEPAATKFGIESELVLSIIRQESSFDPMARSSADAFGLMQLLPTIAKLHEKNANVHLENHEDLYLPKINIPVGVSLLSQLSHKYHGQLILTAAAYNASEKAINTWLKTRLREDPLEFIEDIPYEETRAYVKLVLRNYIFYRRMNKIGESLPFPRNCLENLQLNKSALENLNNKNTVSN